MSKTYIIGDVHGCIKTLLALINKLPEDAKIIFVGDLIDRGPDSSRVVEFVKSNGYDCVLGNHELMMLEDLPKVDFSEKNKFNKTGWEYNGGTKCLNSYVNKLELLKEHYEWMQTLPVYLHYPELKDKQGRELIVSHSNALGVFRQMLKAEEKINKYSSNTERFQMAVSELHDCQSEILWTRTFNERKEKKYFNIFGHTPTEYIIEQNPAANIENNVYVERDYGFADIDTGCVFNKRLTAIEFPSLETVSQEFIG